MMYQRAQNKQLYLRFKSQVSPFEVQNRMLGGACTLSQVIYSCCQTVLPAPVVAAAGHAGGKGAEVTAL